MTQTVKRRMMAVLFALYALIMLWLLYGQRARTVFPSAGVYYGEEYLMRLRQSYNLVPFRTVRQFAALLETSRSAFLARHAFINLAGNIVMFVPLGVFLPYFFEKLRRYGRFAAVTAVLIVLVELVQWVSLLGRADIDDLILNVLGASVGFALFRLWARKPVEVKNVFSDR